MARVRDSVFQNEITPFTENAFHHFGLPYAYRKDTIPYIFPEKFYPKRKDSARMRMLIIKRTDSIRKKYKK
ncbi:MAG: hypothetical protein L3J20_07960 [Flavobacteriaceae bacterium]|nr:hypothetical protein [Flavobacteriaceae bacterium]